MSRTRSYDLQGVDTIATATILEPATSILPRSPDFIFGPVPAQVLSDFFSAAGMHEVGTYLCEDVIVEDTFLLRNNDRILVANQLNMHADKIASVLEKRDLDDSRVLRRLDGLSTLITGPGYSVFGHWLSDFLPKLFVLHASGYDLAKLKFLQAADVPSFGTEFLRLLGVPPANIVSFDPRCERLAIPKLLLPTKLHNGTRSSGLLGEASQFLKKAVEAAAGPLTSELYPPRLLLSREGWKSRPLRNRTRIEEMALGAGFRRYKPEQLPLFEQMRLFYGAREIVTEYGSGIHGSLFACHGLTVCCLRGSTFQPMFIQTAIGAALGQPTGYVFGLTDSDSRFSDFTVAEQDVADCLQRVFRPLLPPRQLIDRMPVGLIWCDAEIGAGNYDRAIALLNDLLQQAARPDELLVRYVELLDRCSAITQSQRQDTPDQPETIRRRLAAAALIALRRLTKLDGAAINAAIRLADILAHGGDGTTAIRLLKRLSSLPSQHIQITSRLADLLERAGRASEAKDVWQSVLRTAPNDARPHREFIKLLLRDRCHDDAERSAREAVERHPASADFKMLLSDVLADRADIDAAIAAAEEAVRLAPQRADFCWQLGDLLRRAGDLEQSERLLRRAIQLAPHEAHPHGQLGQILSAAGRHTEAVAMRRKALELQPTNPHRHAQLSHVQMAAGDLQGAEASILAAIKLAPDRSDFHFDLSRVLTRAHREDEAIRAATRAVAAEPGNSRFQAVLGDLLLRVGDIRGAAAAYSAAMVADPRDVHAREQLERARALLHAGSSSRPAAAEPLTGC